MIPAAWICLFLPLAGALVITLAGNAINRRAAGLIGTASVAGAFVAAVWCFVEMLSRDEAERAQASTAWSWLTAGDLDFGLQIYVDQLAVFMMLIVSGVGALIVGYSIGYMDKVDEERASSRTWRSSSSRCCCSSRAATSSCCSPPGASSASRPIS